MNCTAILNQLVSACHYISYLEISAGSTRNFNSIRISHTNKTLLNSQGSAETRSDANDSFFIKNNRKFQLILIDGLHHAEQVYRDIDNALAALATGGTIVCHDMNPTDYQQQVIPRSQRIWTGDCWKAWVRLRSERADLDMKVVETDYGCGIIRAGSQNTLSALPELEWGAFVKNRREWLNLISVSDFIALYPLNGKRAFKKNGDSESHIYYGSPYSSSKRLGHAYNAFVSIVPRPTDFACLTDADAVFTIPNYGDLIEQAVNENPDARLFTAKTNRIGCSWQLDRNAPTGDDMRQHRDYGRRLAGSHGAAVLIVPREAVPGSGFFILVRKDLWSEVRFKETGILAVDNDFFKRAVRMGETILQLQGIYLYHWYRGGNSSDISHLKL